MSTLELDVGDLKPRAVEFTASELVVTLVDGRKIATPLDLVSALAARLGGAARAITKSCRWAFIGRRSTKI